MWIKICANTNVEDALLAARLGADALGFVFAPSSRQVSAEEVAAIATQLPREIERVGVFGGVGADAIASAAEVAGLTSLQLHGGFDPRLTERLTQLLGPEIGLIQVIHWEVDDSAGSSKHALEVLEALPAKSRLLVDAKVGNASGGTGVAFDWAAAKPLFALANARGVHLILAGGLRPGTVANAIDTLRPWGVDVASGVEQSPGRKDPAKLKAFIEAARLAPRACSNGG